MNEQEVEVLIVGGGSVGLATALFLGQQGVSSLLVERHTATSNHPKARGINYRSMELFRSVGLAEAIRQAGAALVGNRFMLVVDTLAGREFHRSEGMGEIEARSAVLSPEAWCFCAQDELEPVLLGEIRRQGSEVRFGTELVSFKQAANDVRAVIADRSTGQQTDIGAKYMIAADGAGSPIRQKLGIGMSGKGTLEYYVSIFFRADLTDLVRDRQFGMCFVQNQAARGALSSVNNADRWVFNLPYLPENGQQAADFTPERCRDLVRTAIGLPQLEVELISILPWEAAALVADHYGEGRVFLVGDAAHVMPPSGAFGLNTGLQDAHNLAWKLAAVLNEGANPTLLTTYETERRPVGQFTVEQAALRLDFRAKRPDPNQPAPVLADDLIVMLGYEYASPAIFAPAASIQAPAPQELELNGQPGSRAPHLWLERQGQTVSTLDLFGRAFVLLTGEAGTDWQAAASALSLKDHLKLETYRIGPTGDLQDPANQWPATYGVSLGGAVLVRPDGFVAWRSPGPVSDPAQVLNEAFDYNSKH